MRRARMPASTALPLLLCFGCVAPPVTVLPDIPAPLLSCRPEPALPDMKADGDLAHYLLDLAAAGQDCRARLDEVRGLLTRT